jgi:hypothetical protein
MESIPVEKVEGLLFAPLLVKPKDAARLLSISSRKLWELTACGSLLCVRIGKAVRYDPNDLKAFIEHQKRKR